MREISFLEAITEAMFEEMERNDKVFLIGEDQQWSQPKLYEKFGKERVRNAPLSESAQAAAGVGAAITGMRPIVFILFGNIIALTLDHIVNNAAETSYLYGGAKSCPVVFRFPIGISGRGDKHHAGSTEMQLLNTPGLTVIMPSTPYDMKGLLKSALRYDNPVISLESHLCNVVRGLVPDGDYTVPIGVADVKREGKDVTIVAAGGMLHRSLEAAEKLQKDGVSCEVVDPRTLLPLDEDTIINSVKKTGRLVVVHEAPRRYGYGAEIAAIVAEKALEYLDAPIKRIGNPGTPLPFTPMQENAIIPNVNDIIKAVKEIT